MAAWKYVVLGAAISTASVQEQQDARAALATGNWQPIVADSGATGCIMVVKLLPTAAPPPHNAKVYTVESFLEEHSLPAECQA